MKKVSVLIKDADRQYEGLRTSLGLLLEDMNVHMYVIDNKVADMSEAYSDNLSFIDEMGGFYYSNNRENVDKYGFRYASIEAIAEQICDSDTIIPF